MFLSRQSLEAGLKKVAAWAEARIVDQAWRGSTGGQLGNILRAFPAQMWDLFQALCVRADEAVTLPTRSPISVLLKPI